MKLHFIIEMQKETSIMQEDNAAVKPEREKPEGKKTWQGVKAWGRKHGTTFDTLEALQFTGWLSLLIAFIFVFPIFRACCPSSSIAVGQSSLCCACPHVLL